MEREIWFKRWLGNYIPCHWKGWAVTLADISAIFAAFVFAQDAVAKDQAPDWLPFLCIAGGVLAFSVIAWRHS